MNGTGSQDGCHGDEMNGALSGGGFHRLQSGRWGHSELSDAAFGFEVGDWYSYAGGFGNRRLRSLARTTKRIIEPNFVSECGRISLRKCTLELTWKAWFERGELRQLVTAKPVESGWIGDLALGFRSCDFPQWSRSDLKYVRSGLERVVVGASSDSYRLVSSTHHSYREVGLLPSDYVVSDSVGKAWRIHTRVRAGSNGGRRIVRGPGRWSAVRVPLASWFPARLVPLYSQEEHHPKVPLQLTCLQRVEAGQEFGLEHTVVPN